MLVEDQAVLVRGLVLPEENAAAQDFGAGYRAARSGARAAAVADFDTRVAAEERRTRQMACATARRRSTICSTRKPGDTQVRLRLESPRDFTVILDVPAKVRPDREFRAEIEKLCGAEAIEVLAN